MLSSLAPEEHSIPTASLPSVAVDGNLVTHSTAKNCAQKNREEGGKKAISNQIYHKLSNFLSRLKSSGRFHWISRALGFNCSFNLSPRDKNHFQRCSGITEEIAAIRTLNGLRLLRFLCNVRSMFACMTKSKISLRLQKRRARKELEKPASNLCEFQLFFFCTSELWNLMRNN